MWPMPQIAFLMGNMTIKYIADLGAPHVQKNRMCIYIYIHICIFTYIYRWLTKWLTCMCLLFFLTPFSSIGNFQYFPVPVNADGTTPCTAMTAPSECSKECKLPTIPVFHSKNGCQWCFEPKPCQHRLSQPAFLSSALQWSRWGALVMTGWNRACPAWPRGEFTFVNGSACLFLPKGWGDCSTWIFLWLWVKIWYP